MSRLAERVNRRPAAGTAPPAAAGPARPAGYHSVKRRQTMAAYGFIAPAMIIFAAMLIVPLGYAGYLSLFRERLVGGTVFVGLENYAEALADPLFLGGVGRMALFLVIQVPVMLTIALVFALVLDSGRVRLGRFIRLGIFIPYAVPSVIAALMWGYLYGPDFGLFAQVSRAVGLGTPQFLSPDWILASIANITTWEYVGYNMIILFAALRAVPTERYEAAAVDGAGAIRTAWSVKIPAIRPALLLTVIFSVIGSFQLFNEPQVLSVLAPTSIGSAYTPNLYAFHLAFTNQQVNYSAAVSFLLGIFIVIVSYVVMLASNRRNRS